VQDDLKLRRWDHHGYHDLRLAAESSQRKLHKCRRRAVAAVRRPVSPLFARLADALGIQLVKGVVAGLSVDAVISSASLECPEGIMADLAGRGEPSQQETTSGGVEEVDGQAEAWHKAVMQTLHTICSPSTTGNPLTLLRSRFGVKGYEDMIGFEVPKQAVQSLDFPAVQSHVTFKT
jgi:hypothetical protein